MRARISGAMKMRRVAWASRCDVSSRENNEFKLLVLLRLDSTRPATKLTSESEVGPHLGVRDSGLVIGASRSVI